MMMSLPTVPKANAPPTCPVDEDGLERIHAGISAGSASRTTVPKVSAHAGNVSVDDRMAVLVELVDYVVPHDSRSARYKDLHAVLLS